MGADAPLIQGSLLTCYAAVAPYAYENGTSMIAPTVTASSRPLSLGTAASRPLPTGGLSRSNQTHSQCCFVVQDTVTADYWARMTPLHPLEPELILNRLLHLDMVWATKPYLRNKLHHGIYRHHNNQL